MGLLGDSLVLQVADCLDETGLLGFTWPWSTIKVRVVASGSCTAGSYSFDVNKSISGITPYVNGTCCITKWNSGWDNETIQITAGPPVESVGLDFSVTYYPRTQTVDISWDVGFRSYTNVTCGEEALPTPPNIDGESADPTTDNSYQMITTVVNGGSGSDVNRNETITVTLETGV